MPSHIFTRLGLWQESIDWNKRSAIAAAKYPFQGKISHHMFHALDYEIYALLQLGEDQKAKDVMKSIDTLKDPFFPSAATAYAIAAMPSRIPLENHLWSEAAQVASPDTNVVPWKKFPQWEALIHYGRGLGAAHSGNTELAEKSLARLKELQNAVGTAPQTKYWYDQIEAQMLALQGWMIYATGKKDEGLASLKQAADLEDATSKNPVSPGELLPAREQLGDMLMEMKKAKDALVAYETSLMSRPNRFNSLYGAGAASEAEGDQAKAKEYYSKILDATVSGTSKRDRLDHARKFVSPG
jgi:tetratricopeptide (TPR) repeat protein